MEQKNQVSQLISGILDAMPEKIIVLNRRGKTIYANAKAKAILEKKGPEKSWLLQQADNVYEMWDETGKKLKSQEHPGIRALKDGKAHEQLITFRVKGQKEVYREVVRAIPIRGEKGRPEGVLKIFQALEPGWKSERAITFLNKISSFMAAPLDYKERLRILCRSVVPEVADYCWINIVNESGRIERLIIQAANEQRRREWIKKMGQAAKQEGETADRRVILSGKAEVYGRGDDAEEKLFGVQATKERSRLTGLAIMPLTARGVTMGSIGFGWGESGRIADGITISFVRELVRRAATLVDNARLYNQARRELEKQEEISARLAAQEATLKLALEAGAMGVWDWDIPGDKMRWSEQMKRIVGLRKNEEPGPAIRRWQRIHPEDRARLEELMKRALEGENLVSEHRIIEKNGEEKWLLVRGQTIKGSDGSPQRMVGIAMDISERKKIETAIRESEQRFKEVFALATEGIFLADEKGKIVQANLAANQLLMGGKKPAEGEWMQKIITGQKPALDEQLNLLHEQLTINGMWEIDRGNEGTKYLGYSARAHVWQGMNLFVIRDMTEWILEEKRREHFLGVASHELKSPLASTKALIEIIRLKKGDISADKLMEYSERINSKIDSLAQRINDLLDVTRIRQNKLELVETEVDFQQLVTQSINDLKMAIPDHPIHLTGRIKCKTYVDPGRISQVMENLISNAAKYSAVGKDIIVTLRNSDGIITVEVKDYGLGIQKEDMKRLFDLYYRGADARKEHIRGLGVGLFISKVIVERHGGEMWVKSQPDKGSTFYFTVPIIKEPGE